MDMEEVGAFTVAEWERYRKLGHTKANEEIQAGRVRSYKVGRRRYISRDADLAWQRAREEETNAALEAA